MWIGTGYRESESNTNIRGFGREEENEDRTIGRDGCPEPASDAEAGLAVGWW